LNVKHIVLTPFNILLYLFTTNLNITQTVFISVKSRYDSRTVQPATKITIRIPSLAFH